MNRARDFGSMAGAGGSRVDSFPHVRHFNRATWLDRLASNGRPLRELVEDVGRGEHRTTTTDELRAAITRRDNERTN